jgi:hypothetical protein
MIGGATGERDGGDAGWEIGAVVDRVGTAAANAGADVASAVETAPVSSDTNLSETALPEKNSPAVIDGSIDGAGGKMSDWNESDYGCVCMSVWAMSWR